jgi:lipopolysaccharide/colanic/teichoic acid biosynthesis glycosyltransferase
MRKTRIDELPQLWNVLRNDMSFVGPRPERPVFVDRLQEIIPHYSLRHTVKPGLTGWAQIRYPYGASEEDALRKLEYELYYIKNTNLLMDTMIILQTIKTVLFQKGGR